MTPLSRAPAAPRTRDEKIIIECDLPEPPEKVWRALTEPALLAAWLLCDDALLPDSRQGPVREPPDPGTLEPLAAEPHQFLRYRWSVEETSGAHLRRLESQLDFELTPAVGGGTHLRIVHGDFRESHVIRMGRTVSAGRRPRGAVSPLQPVILAWAA